MSCLFPHVATGAQVERARQAHEEEQRQNVVEQQLREHQGE